MDEPIPLIEGLSEIKTEILQSKKKSYRQTAFEFELQHFPGSPAHQPTL